MVDFVKAPPVPREGYEVEKEWQEYLDVVHRNFVREAYGPDLGPNFVFPRKILDLEQAVREDWFENYPFKEQDLDKAKTEALSDAYLDFFDKNFKPKRLEQAWQAMLQNYRNYLVMGRISGRVAVRFVFPREILDAEDELREIIMEGNKRSEIDKEKAEEALLDLYDKLVGTEDARNREMQWQNLLQESNHRGLVEATYGLGNTFVYPQEVLDAEEELRDVLGYSLRFRDVPRETNVHETQASKALSQAYEKVVYGGIRRTDDL